MEHTSLFCLSQKKNIMQQDSLESTRIQSRLSIITDELIPCSSK
jgi:hypothetical protein